MKFSANGKTACGLWLKCAKRFDVKDVLWSTAQRCIGNTRLSVITKLGCFFFYFEDISFDSEAVLFM